MPKHEDVACPRCGASFQCKMGSISICHCSDVQLTKEQTAYLSEQWQGCLCHRCLLELTDSPEQSTANKSSKPQEYLPNS